MSESSARESSVVIPQDILLLRLEQSEELREFTLQMWLQNPALARQAGGKIAELLAPLDTTS
ncbi:MAG: hypothetical protein HXY29_11125 [Rhodocyclaceae bacterium]|jgi:hypothetical protein|nr:hypothetical protein [Rhodocyclaceae bacterium]